MTPRLLMCCLSFIPRTRGPVICSQPGAPLCIYPHWYWVCLIWDYWWEKKRLFKKRLDTIKMEMGITIQTKEISPGKEKPECLLLPEKVSMFGHLFATYFLDCLFTSLTLSSSFLLLQRPFALCQIYYKYFGHSIVRLSNLH